MNTLTTAIREHLQLGTNALDSLIAATLASVEIDYRAHFRIALDAALSADDWQRIKVQAIRRCEEADIAWDAHLITQRETFARLDATLATLGGRL